MLTANRMSRAATAALLVGALAGCSSLGGIGNVLGSVLGGGGSQVTGTVLAVDTRSQYVTLQDQNGQAVSLAYDNNTRVTYNNQNYSVTSLERGDQVTANVQQSNNSNNYYTDLIQVNSSVSGSGTVNGSGNVQTYAGTVRQIDYQNGWFTMDTNNGRYTVRMPYNPRQSDANYFNSLRNGQSVRLYGVFLNNSSIELRQFY
ncbi:MAG TPA: hypothetical protein VGD02_01085 [Gemmatimonadaceae bacterium]